MGALADLCWSFVVVNFLCFLLVLEEEVLILITLLPLPGPRFFPLLLLLYVLFRFFGDGVTATTSVRFDLTSLLEEEDRCSDGKDGRKLALVVVEEGGDNKADVTNVAATEAAARLGRSLRGGVAAK